MGNTEQIARKLDEILAEAGFARRDTRAAQELHNRLEPEHERPLYDGDSVERRDPKEDVFYVTPEERKQFGIQEGEEVTWVQDGRYWGPKIGYDPLRQRLRSLPGARPIRHPDGGFVSNGDLVLVAYPREVKEKAMRELTERLRKTQAAIKDSDISPDIPRYKGPPPPDIAQRAHDMHVAAGLIRTPGMTPEQAFRLMGAKGIEEEEARFRQGGLFTPVPPKGTREREAYEEAKQRAESRKVGRRSFAIGAGFDKDGRIVK